MIPNSSTNIYPQNHQSHPHELVQEHLTTAYLKIKNCREYAEDLQKSDFNKTIT